MIQQRKKLSVVRTKTYPRVNASTDYQLLEARLRLSINTNTKKLTRRAQMFLTDIKPNKVVVGKNITVLGYKKTPIT